MLIRFPVPFYNAADMGGASSAPADQTAGQVDAGTPETSGSDPGIDTNDTPDAPSLDDQLDAIWNEAHGVPARDERGRFKSRNEDTPQGDEPLAEDDDHGERLNASDDDPLDQPGEEGEQSDIDDATDDMPNSWSKDKAEVWKAIPPEAKEIIRQREIETQQALSRAGRAVNTLRQAQPVLDAVAPFSQYLNQVGQHLGKHPAALISDVLRFENTLRTAPDNETKLNVLKDIVAEYGVDVSPLFGMQANEAIRGQKGGDIERHPLVQELRQRLARVESMTIGERQQQMRQQVEEMDTAIQTAAGDTKNFPYFDKVRATMAGLIQAMPDDPSVPVKEVIKRAYDMACRADPEIFARIQRDQQAKMAEEQRQRQRERAQRASRVAASNVRSTVPSPTKRTMDQELDALAAKYYRD